MDRRGRGRCWSCGLKTKRAEEGVLRLGAFGIQKFFHRVSKESHERSEFKTS